MKGTKMTSKVLLLALLTGASLTFATPAVAGDDNGVYVDLHIGGVLQSDKDFDQIFPDASIGAETANIGTGFMGGLGIGYRFSDNISVEAAWDWRRNNLSDFTLSDGTQVTGGDYAANAVTMNGYYHFGQSGDKSLRPFIGAGAGFIEEIDFDQETTNSAVQFQSSGEFVWQVMGGVSYPVSRKIDLDFEVQYLSMGSTNLESTDSVGVIQNIKYNPTTASVGLKYKF